RGQHREVPERVPHEVSIRISNAVVMPRLEIAAGFAHHHRICSSKNHGVRESGFVEPLTGLPGFQPGSGEIEGNASDLNVPQCATPSFLASASHFALVGVCLFTSLPSVRVASSPRSLRARLPIRTTTRGPVGCALNAC